MRLWRRLCCTSLVAGRLATTSGDLAVCAARAVLQLMHVQLVRAAALEIDAGHWSTLLSKAFVLALDHIHKSFLLPWILLHTFIRTIGMGPDFAIHGLCACV